jgi:RNA polymerase sigma-70 factor (ECF subfamily)
MTDRARFERLTITHMDSAWRLANSIVRSSTDAEDVVQEAYLRAFQAFDRFSGEDVRPWLLTIVRNAALQRLATMRRSLNVVSFEDPYVRRDGGAAIECLAAENEPTPEMQLIAKADRAMVSAALAELSTSFREILILREFEGCSYSEIAKIIGAPPGTVMSRLARARGELKRVLIRMIENGGSNAV